MPVRSPKTTEMFSHTIVAPPELRAVTLYEASADTELGVPLITPVLELSARPAGKAGDTLKLVGEPPDVEGALAAISMPML